MITYRLTHLAENDLSSIIDYIASHNPGAARRLLKKFHTRFEALAAMPESGRPREEFGRGLRSSVVGSYLVFYRIVDSEVEILRVAHGARNLPDLFANE
jgi:toxin ParE1/3/4